MQKGLRKILDIGLIYAALWSFAPRAYAEVPADFQAIIFAKVLKFDRNVESRVKGDFNIAFVYRGDNESSKAHHAEVFEKFKSKMEAEQVSGKKVTVTSVSIDSAAAAGAVADASKYAAIYLSRDLGDYLQPIVEKAKTAQILTYTENRDYFTKGVAVGIKLESGKPKIVINKGASDASGASFDPRLLTLAEVIN